MSEGFEAKGFDTSVPGMPVGQWADWASQAPEWAPSAAHIVVVAPHPDDANQALRQQLGATGKFLVCYVGTMGMAHGLETLLDAAARLSTENPEVLFLLIGEGAEKERIKALAQ